MLFPPRRCTNNVNTPIVFIVLKTGQMAKHVPRILKRKSLHSHLLRLACRYSNLPPRFGFDAEGCSSGLVNSPAEPEIWLALHCNCELQLHSATGKHNVASPY